LLLLFNQFSETKQIMPKLHNCILVLFLFSVQATGSELKIAKFEFETDETGKCRNGGIAVLDNNFCACQPEFTGRHCEIFLPDTKNSCGPQFLDQEKKYLDCAECSCKLSMLTCAFAQTESCNLNNFKERLNIKRKSNLNILKNVKKLDLVKRIQMINLIEGYAYKHYIKQHHNEFDYEIVFINEFTEKPIVTHERKGKHGRNKIFVFVSDESAETISALYFPQGSGVDDNSHALNHGMRIKADFFRIFYILEVFFILTFFNYNPIPFFLSL
jgi:hypothetical protein